MKKIMTIGLIVLLMTGVYAIRDNEITTTGADEDLLLNNTGGYTRVEGNLNATGDINGTRICDRSDNCLDTVALSAVTPDSFWNKSTNTTLTDHIWVSTDQNGLVFDIGNAGSYRVRNSTNYIMTIDPSTAANNFYMNVESPSGEARFILNTGSKQFHIQDDGGNDLFNVFENGTLSAYALNSANCDLKATTEGRLYCGTDNSGDISFSDSAWINDNSKISSNMSVNLGNVNITGNLTISGGTDKPWGLCYGQYCNGRQVTGGPPINVFYGTADTRFATDGEFAIVINADTDFTRALRFINNSGNIVGIFSDNSRVITPVYWDKTSRTTNITILQDNDGNNAIGNPACINNKGEIVGDAKIINDAGGTIIVPFYWSDENTNGQPLKDKDGNTNTLAGKALSINDNSNVGNNNIVGVQNNKPMFWKTIEDHAFELNNSAFGQASSININNGEKIVGGTNAAYWGNSKEEITIIRTPFEIDFNVNVISLGNFINNNGNFILRIFNIN